MSVCECEFVYGDGRAIFLLRSNPMAAKICRRLQANKNFIVHRQKANEMLFVKYGTSG